MNSVSLFLDKWISRMEKLLTVLASAMLIIMTAIICFSVFGRYIFNYPAAWSVEVSEYMMVAITFFTASWILKHDGHVSLDLIFNYVGPSLQKLAMVITCLVGTVACGLLTWFSLDITINYYQRDIVLLKLIDMPHYIVIAPIFIGSFVMTLRYLNMLIIQLFDNQKKGEQ